MRPSSAVLLLLLASVIVLPLGQQSATASCAGPSLVDAEHLVLLRGATTEIHGERFANGCQDTGSCTETLGCTSCSYGPKPTPLSDIGLSLEQDGRTWTLGTADAHATQGDFGAVAWTVEIPGDVERGRATLVPDQGQPTIVRVR
jgi:hypothetical protein